MDRLTATIKDGEIYSDQDKIVPAESNQPAKGRKPRNKVVKNQFPFDVRSHMTKLSGVDLCEVEGISEVTIMELIAEKGTDINQCPNIKISEGNFN